MGRFYFYASLIIVLQACTSVPKNLFRKSSPHEKYQQQLEAAGLKQSVMGSQWINASQTSLASALTINVPYKETGYFSASEVKAVALRFTVKRGEKININLSKRPSEFKVYLDLWEYRNGQSATLLAFADTTGAPLQFDADSKTDFILRLQPELLSGGEYTLTVTAGPVLAYPVANPKANRIGSFFGNDRDKGARSHEGIDMFSTFRTPVVAAADGMVTRVGVNNLGGKVVFMRPSGKDYSLYYAHLDSQIVSSGQLVSVGDTLGLMGNTGNAQSTPPHLHFGVYTSSGAVDPLPFVSLKQENPPAITAGIDNLSKTIRSAKNAKLYPANNQKSVGISITEHVPMLAEAATGNFYKVRLPDNSVGFIPARSSSLASSATDKRNLRYSTNLYDQPDTSAAKKLVFNPGTTVTVIGKYKGFELVKSVDGIEGWVKE